MPEILVVWSLGAGLCFLLVNWNLFLVHRSYHTPQFKSVNIQLSKIGLYWSRSHSRLMELPSAEGSWSFEELLKSEYQAETRSSFLFGTLLLPLSWLGSVLMILYWLYLRRERHQTMEHNIFTSRLAQGPEDLRGHFTEGVRSEAEVSGEVREILQEILQSKQKNLRWDEIERLKALGFNLIGEREDVSFDS